MVANLKLSATGIQIVLVDAAIVFAATSQIVTLRGHSLELCTSLVSSTRTARATVVLPYISHARTKAVNRLVSRARSTS